MSKFYVGQRVRLTRAANPKNIGIIGTIVRFEFWPKGTVCCDGVSKNDADCVVKYDTRSINTLEHTSRLEPATDSNELVSWEFMRDLWVPEHMRVSA